MTSYYCSRIDKPQTWRTGHRPGTGFLPLLGTLLLGLGCSGAAVVAQEQVEPVSIAIGPGYLTPGVEIVGGHIDNLLYQPDNEVETFIARVTPDLLYEIGDDVGGKLSLEWLLDAGHFAASSADNYVDNTVRAEFAYQPTSRFSGSVAGVFNDMHDWRGTGLAEGDMSLISPTPDQWQARGIDGTVAYGGEEAIARIEFDAGHLDKEYTNNRLFTYIRDRTDSYGAGRFFYRVAPATRLLLEGRVARSRYDENPFNQPSLDSDSDRVYAGATWEATASTTGSLKVGYINKEFRDAGRIDMRELGWEAELDWRPVTYSVFNFVTARDFLETNGIGDFIQRDFVDVNWRHDWLQRLSSRIGLRYAVDTFNPTVREDELREARVGVDYLMRRWLMMSAAYRFNQRDSTDDAFDFDRSIFELAVRIVL